MKCNQCGYEGEQNFSICPSCGTQFQIVSTASSRIMPALKDPLFMVLCILMSVSCLFGMAMGNFSVIDVLLAVFLWLTYAAARKDEIPAKHLRCVSGSVFALYVINYVLAGLFLLIGVILSFVLNAVLEDPTFINGLGGLIADPADLEMFTEIMGAVSGVVVFIVFTIVAILIAVVNFFSNRYFHGFAQSVYKSLETDTLALKHVNASRVWLIIGAVISGFSVLSTLLGDAADTALGLNSANLATTIICILLINKYLKPEE